MILQNELHQALVCALAAAAPLESPIFNVLGGVFLDFAGPHTLRLIGTNRQKMTVVSLEVTHYQPDGTQLSIATRHVQEILEAFPAYAMPSGHKLTLCLFDGQLILTDGRATVTVPDAKRKMPDYAAALAPPEEPRQPVGKYDLGYFRSALDSMGVRGICDGTVSVEIYGPTAPLFLRPILPLTLQHIRSVDMVIAPRRMCLSNAPVERVEESAE